MNAKNVDEIDTLLEGRAKYLEKFRPRSITDLNPKEENEKLFRNECS